MEPAQDAYSFIAHQYDRLLGPFLGGLRRAGLDLWPPQRGWRVLDVGCGTGAQLEVYQQAGCAVAGIEASPAMAQVARRRLGEHAALELADASRMPFAPASFDLVLASMMLHELDTVTRDAILDECARVLRPGGRLLVIDYHPGPLRIPHGWLVRPFILAAERLAGREHYRNHLAFLAAGGMPALAGPRGFAIQRARVRRGGTFGVYLLARSATSARVS
ncbi:MAG: class I SAM-dependent methyltransferase [Vicinamibacterales bacterium]